MKKLLPLLLLILLSCNDQQPQKPTPQQKVSDNSLKVEQKQMGDSAAIEEVKTTDSPEDTAKREKWLSDTVLFTSGNPDEKLLHVRVHTKGDTPTYFFLGTEVPKDSTDRSKLVRMYELTEHFGLYVIDSAPLYCFEGEWISSDNGVIFEEFLYRNYDNLYIQKDTLFYFTEHGVTDKAGSGSQQLRKFFAYAIGSESKAVSISAERFYENNPRRTINALEVLSFSPSGKQIAYSDIYNVYFHKSKNYTKEDMYEAYINKEIMRDTLYDIRTGDFELQPNFPDTLGRDPYKPCDERALFGGMNWYPNEKVLFFDNSGYCYACVWMINLETKSCTKLVPDHEAIHPFYFTRFEQEFLAYVQENQIRKFSLAGVL